ncbi:hypothetical protein VNO80_14184 [Phaseolus coccineus]|uniref:Uncharacterized protein n=1 Tax=Phaseolus coccineus TaxID=3886 RepID=A0AAN9MI90_PHACN
MSRIFSWVMRFNGFNFLVCLFVVALCSVVEDYALVFCNNLYHLFPQIHPLIVTGNTPIVIFSYCLKQTFIYFACFHQVCRFYFKPQ